MAYGLHRQWNAILIPLQLTHVYEIYFSWSESPQFFKLICIIRQGTGEKVLCVMWWRFGTSFLYSGHVGQWRIHDVRGMTQTSFRFRLNHKAACRLTSVGLWFLSWNGTNLGFNQGCDLWGFRYSAIMKMIAWWHTAPCSLVVDRRFEVAYYHRRPVNGGRTLICDTL